MYKPIALLLFCSLAAAGAPKRVLYFTHSAGFVHGSLGTSCEVLKDLGSRTGEFDVVCSEDLALISADGLREFDILYFFTSGELELNDRQKADLLNFVREGKGFGGAHSATDTLYNWPEYGEMIGAYFNGHPWAQEVAVRVEELDSPLARGLEATFRISDEIYQFRDFSRDRVHVLLSLDTSSVDLSATGVAREDGDFPLAWYRDYGAGRVFYTALGHPDETWRDARFQILLLNALRWLGGDIAPAER
jgi:type 1 glutamine amidotransferase